MGKAINYPELFRLRELGLRNAEIATRLGCSIGSVSNAAKRFGVPRRSPGQPRPVDEQLFRDLWMADVPLPDIAVRLGVSVSTVYTLRERYGLPFRQPVKITAAIDPTPEEIAERARECRERHYAERRGESAGVIYGESA